MQLFEGYIRQRKSKFCVLRGFRFGMFQEGEGGNGWSNSLEYSIKVGLRGVLVRILYFILSDIFRYQGVLSRVVIFFDMCFKKLFGKRLQEVLGEGGSWERSQEVIVEIQMRYGGDWG